MSKVQRGKRKRGAGDIAGRIIGVLSMPSDKPQWESKFAYKRRQQVFKKHDRCGEEPDYHKEVKRGRQG